MKYDYRVLFLIDYLFCFIDPCLYKTSEIAAGNLGYKGYYY